MLHWGDTKSRQWGWGKWSGARENVKQYDMMFYCVEQRLSSRDTELLSHWSSPQPQGDKEEGKASLQPLLGGSLPHRGTPGCVILSLLSLLCPAVGCFIQIQRQGEKSVSLTRRRCQPNGKAFPLPGKCLIGPEQLQCDWGSGQRQGWWVGTEDLNPSWCPGGKASGFWRRLLPTIHKLYEPGNSLC